MSDEKPLPPTEWTELLRVRGLELGEPIAVAEEILGDRPRQSPIVSMTRVIVVDDGHRPFPPSAIPARDPLGE